MWMSMLLSACLGGADAPERRDVYSDPLPEGAIARLGTVRLRHERLIAFAVRPDGETVRTIGGDGAVREWNVTTGALVRAVHPQKTEAADKATAAGFQNISSDGRLVVATGTGVGVWDAETGKRLALVAPKNSPLGVPQWSPDGTLLAFCDPNKADAWLLDWRSGAERTIPLPKPKNANNRTARVFNQPVGVCFAPDGRHLIVVHAACGVLSVVKLADLEEVYRLEGPCHGVAVSPDGKTLAVCWPTEGTFTLHDFATGKQIVRNPVEKSPSNPVFSPNSALVACNDGGDTIVMDVATWRVIRRIPASPSQLGFAANGRVVVGRIGNYRLQVWDVETAKPRFGPGEFDWNCGAVVAPNGRFLVTTESDVHSHGTYVIWDLTDGRLNCRIKLEADTRGCAMAFGDDGRLVVGSDNGLLHYYDVLKSTKPSTVSLTTPEEPTGFPEDTFFHKGVWLSPDAGTAASGFIGRMQHGIPVTTRVTVRTLSSTRTVCELQFAGSAVAYRSSTVATWDWNGDRFCLISPRSGRTISRIPITSKSLGISWNGPLCTLSEDGRLLGAQTERDQVDVWEVASGRRVARIETGYLSAMALGPDNRTLVTTGMGVLRVWDLATGRERGQRNLRLLATDPEHGVGNWLVLTPDGRRAVTNMADGTALVWDLAGFAIERLKPTSDGGEESWKSLLKDDPKEAYGAVWRMAEAPGTEVVRYLRGPLKPAAGPDPAVVRQLIAGLGDDEFRTRESASEKLAALGPVMRDELRKVRTDTASPEVRGRVDEILKKLNDAKPTPEQLRRLRAIQVLERVGSTDAKDVLRELARGASGEPETDEAQAALARLERYQRKEK